MEYEEFQKLNNLRMIYDNEIVIEFDVDDVNTAWWAANDTCANLYGTGYSFQIWDHKGRSPHIHLVINELEKIDNAKTRKKYKELFLKKYVPKKYHEYLDFSLCGKHLIAEENKPHWKHKHIKRFVNIWNESRINYPESKLLEEAQKIKTRKPEVRGSGITAEFVKRISIIELAEKRYKLEIDSRGFALCPWHNDNDPSLKFYDEQGRFVCFGCQKKGNIVDFVKEMESLKKSG